MSNDKQVIRSEDVGSLEELLGLTIRFSNRSQSKKLKNGYVQDAAIGMLQATKTVGEPKREMVDVGILNPIIAVTNRGLKMEVENERIRLL